MTTPTCPWCGTKFPNDPCKKCHIPAGITKAEAEDFRKSYLRTQGMSKKQVKRALNPHPATKRKRKHGRPV